MGIYRFSGVRIVCDVCQEAYDWTVFLTVQEAREQVASDGWQVNSRNDVRCPDCKEKDA